MTIPQSDSERTLVLALEIHTGKISRIEADDPLDTKGDLWHAMAVKAVALYIRQRP